jgi:hypothetical protein
LKARVINGLITIELAELADSLTEGDRAELSHYLVARDTLFAAVLECVVTGEYFSSDTAPWWFDKRTVLALREQLLPMMTEIQQEAVKEALRQRDSAQAEADRYKEWAWKMYHSEVWNIARTGRPDLPR